MRYLVLSDIHANIEALDAVLWATPAYDATLVLGDLVGYGASPNEVIAQVQSLRNPTFIRGNHDKVAAELEPARSFNHLARQAIEWTTSTLTPDNLRWLVDLPRGPIQVSPRIEICHGSTVHEDTYIFDDLDAVAALKAATCPLCLFGHTHVPALYSLSQTFDVLQMPSDGVIHLDTTHGQRLLVNCGAVGQPRDGDPRAAYGLLDTAAGTLTVLRQEYDIPAARARILEQGLPEMLATRLAVGR